MQNKQIHFTKMHGLGNDFVIINALTEKINLSVLNIKKLSNRFIGIGFDQLLILEKTEQANFFCRIFNADGSEAEQCGNGLRCIASYIYEQGLAKTKYFSIATLAGVFQAEIVNTNLVTVTMGEPCFIPEKIPFITATPQVSYSIETQAWQQPMMMSVLSLGNPHAIIEVDSISDFPVAEVGAEIGSCSAFPLGVNVGFMEIVNSNHIRLRTFERGSGETFACGSNACAAAIAGIQKGTLKHNVRVELLLGNLDIEWQTGQMVKQTGPTESVFAGTFII
jgi:diaminopimelate epimerase